jgi:hypothetical protein
MGRRKSGEPLFGGVENQLGWSTVAIYLLLAVGFGYFRFAKPVNA